MRIPALFLLLATAAPAFAQPPNPQIDYPGFQRLTQEARPYRQGSLIDWATFQRLARQPDVLILDARSESAFARGHIRGAVNLPFTDFTADSLARVIGRADRPILIYCNNNFSNNADPVPRKLIQVALNIQTFINLYGYGYRNVRELNEVIDFNAIGGAWVRAPALAAR